SPTGDTKQIMSEWPVMVKEFADHTDFGGFMKRAQGKTDKLVESLNLGGKSTMEKIRAVDQYIKSNYNWDKHTGKFVNQSIKDFMKNKVGNVAEINLFYAALLNNLGVNANPVLLSTRDHGKIKSQYPFQHFFNYVVVAVNLDGETMLLDGTEPLSACGELPVRCINDKGLLIQKEKTNNAVWVPINSRGDSGMEYKIHIRPMATPDSTFIDFQINSTGYDATRLRRLYLNDEKELRNELDLKTYNLRNPLKGENERSPDKSFLISGIAKTALEVVEDKIIVSPFCNFIPTENPLKQTLRSYPVDMIYKKGRTFETIIDLPKGYQMMNKPTTIDLSNQEVDIQYAVTQLNESSIQVKGTYRFKRDVYGASSYPDLKRYFNSIVDKLNDRIILIKKP
ncbi:MAG: transglutaminase-like domain-containing protein, partial [Marinilabiliales bacterium]|nr:transglutaminase-like domain-containing protein [Marinilabiliales bacterium]